MGDVKVVVVTQACRADGALVVDDKVVVVVVVVVVSESCRADDALVGDVQIVVVTNACRAML